MLNVEAQTRRLANSGCPVRIPRCHTLRAPAEFPSSAATLFVALSPGQPFVQAPAES